MFRSQSTFTLSPSPKSPDRILAASGFSTLCRIARLGVRAPNAGFHPSSAICTFAASAMRLQHFLRRQPLTPRRRRPSGTAASSSIVGALGTVNETDPLSAIADTPAKIRYSPGASVAA